jgi:hypothetical protein
MNKSQQLAVMTAMIGVIGTPMPAVPLAKRKRSPWSKFTCKGNTNRYKKKDRNKARKDRR